MESIKNWWAEASSRDQLAIVILGIAIAIYTLYVGVLSSFTDMRVEQERRVEAQKNAYERVKNLAAELDSIQNGNDFNDGGSSVEKNVQSSIAQNGLRVSGFDASGRSGIRVRFETVDYEKLLAWLYDLEISQGLRLKDVTIAGLSDPGLVSASVLIQKN